MKANRLATTYQPATHSGGGHTQATEAHTGPLDLPELTVGEYIDHHDKEERNQIFPKARAVRGLDLVAMRDELPARKEALMGVAA